MLSIRNGNLYRHNTLPHPPIRPIGAGGQAENWLCRRSSDGNYIVRKRYTEWKSVAGEIPSEAYILQVTIPRHPRILYCDSWGFKADGSLLMYFEYCFGGSLEKYGPRVGYTVPEDFVWHVFVQVAEALVLLRTSRVSFPSRRNFDPSIDFIDHPDLEGNSWVVVTVSHLVRILTWVLVL